MIEITTSLSCYLGVMHVSSRFDSGNAEVLGIELLDDGRTEIRLEIRPDAGDEHLQWFHFRVTGAAKRMLSIRIENAGDASYPTAWSGYRACASYDTVNWFRAETDFLETDEHLVISHRSAHDVIDFAYFAPYSTERHRWLVSSTQRKAGVEHRRIGETLDGRDLDLLMMGEGETPLWFIARQHPGETMAEWFIEGLLDRLTDPADALARKLREKARFYIVPNMNPDGSARGHLRTNAVGENLNRCWAEPTAKSPEVQSTRDLMDEVGLAFCLDVHGDEELPYNFIAGSDGLEELPQSVLTSREVYEDTLKEVCPDFQTVQGYPKAIPGQANMRMATNQLAARFKALCMTLEQPFKDNALAPLPHEGWSPRRAKQLGAAQLFPLAQSLYGAEVLK